MNLFAYGTLQLSEVFRTVTGIDGNGVPATLTDYRCSCLEERSFPGIAPEVGASTEGVLYRGLNEDVFARLDEFEDDFYERVTVTVSVGAASEEAVVYVVAPAHRDLLTGKTWDLAAFERDHLDNFLRARTG